MLGIERRQEDDDANSAVQHVTATIPQREILRYAIDLRSLTHGRGGYHAALSHYEEAPGTVVQEVVNEAKAAGFSTHVEV